MTKSKKQLRWRSDPHYRLRETLAIVTNQLVKRLGEGRGTNSACLKLFGQPRPIVLSHIEAQLQSRGLSWAGYGPDWQLDHRVPMGLATNDNELRALCLLSNCQVLPTEEHKAKTLVDNALCRAARK